jgi:hypothetical protein
LRGPRLGLNSVYKFRRGIVFFEIAFFVLGIVALGQRFYYQKTIEYLQNHMERELMDAKSEGKLEALNDPALVLAAFRKLFTLQFRNN